MMDAPIAPGCLILSVAQVSGIGGRPSNQDALGSAQCGDVVCFVVSDGAGGHEGGEVAANIVVRSIVEAFERAMASGVAADTPFGESVLQSCIAYAMAEVERGKIGNGHLHSMNATVAVVLIDKARRLATWAHLGDTRVYLFRDGRLLHTTKDHSLVQQFIDAGLGDGADIRTHPKRNLLYATIGIDNDVPPAIQPPLPLRNGDAILICTDGLWEWVTEDAMEHSLSHAASEHAWLEALCVTADENCAESAKTRDNFTAQAVWIRGETGQIKP